MRSTKAFVTLEAVVFIGIIFLLFIGSYVVYVAKVRDLITSQREVREIGECNRVAAAITSIFLLGDGAEINLNISTPLTIEPAQQRIETNHSFCTFPVRRIFGNGFTSTPLTTEESIKISRHETYVELQ